jgi:hypothetical protein
VHLRCQLEGTQRINSLLSLQIILNNNLHLQFHVNGMHPIKATQYYGNFSMQVLLRLGEQYPNKCWATWIWASAYDYSTPPHSVNPTLPNGYRSLPQIPQVETSGADLFIPTQPFCHLTLLHIYIAIHLYYLLIH